MNHFQWATKFKRMQQFEGLLVQSGELAVPAAVRERPRTRPGPGRADVNA